MQIIKKISEMIEEELEGAEHYAKMALKHKHDMPELAKVLYDISTDEMRHVHLLHGEVVALIEKHKREHGEAPAAMVAVWDYLHERHIEESSEIKMLQNEYKES